MFASSDPPAQQHRVAIRDDGDIFDPHRVSINPGAIILTVIRGASVRVRDLVIVWTADLHAAYAMDLPVSARTADDPMLMIRPSCMVRT